MEEKIINNKTKIDNYRKLIQQLENENLQLEKKLNIKKIDFNLNNKQLEAVRGNNTNSIIIACPGSGKTHTLISKVINLVVNKNVNPQKIIMITFTKKASMEMNERLRNKIGFNNLQHVGTLHGLAYRTLQKYDKINYTILDDNETNKSIQNQLNILLHNKYKNVYTDEQQSILLKKIYQIYSVNCCQYPQNINFVLRQFKVKEFKIIINDTLKSYDNFKILNKYLDFSDLMIKFVDFLKHTRSTDFRNSYDYIFFDEYQDINGVQDAILKEMNQKCKNLTVVGDDAQAIYAFRGSEIKYILNFKKRFDNVSTFYLEQNYRSTPEIVSFCNDIIKKNKSQIIKNMYPVKTSIGLKPKITAFSNTDSEIKYIINKIKNNLNNGIKLKNQVIITRKNRQLDNFELHLIKNRISYIKSKGIGLMDRIHVKDFMAFLIILVNRNSIIHWKRILNIIPKVGNVTINKIFKICDTKNITIDEIILNHNLYLNMQISKLIKEISIFYKKLMKLYKKLKLTELCEEIICFLEPLIKKNAKDKEKTNPEDKIDDLNTLKNYIVCSDSLVNFLADVYLDLEINKNKNFNDEKNENEDQDQDILLLSTIHGVKGLEWEYVFLSGCSSDIIPSCRNNLYIDELENIQEERRLFYVGCSRAKTCLEITLSYDYHFVSNQIYASPFIKDIDKKLYLGENLIYANRLYKGEITRIVNNYLLIYSSSKIYQFLKTLHYTYESFYPSFVEPIIYKNNCDLIYGTFIDNLITKMVYQKYKEYINKIDVPIYEKINKKKDKYYYQFIDPNNDWIDIIDSILKISMIGCRMKMKYDKLCKLLTSKNQILLYKKIEKMIIDIIEKCLELSENRQKLPKSLINLHYNISFGEILGEADIVVGRTLIEIKTSKDCIACTKYVLQTIMYRYLLRKKGIRIDKIILLNPLLGETYTLHITPKWKETFRVADEILCGN